MNPPYQQPDRSHDTGLIVAAPPGAIRGALGRLASRFGGRNWRGASSFGWSAMSQFSSIFARLFSTLIMTRLLAPKVYGVFATSLAVVMTLEWFSDIGVTPALVRHPRGQEPNYIQTGWWINLIRAAALTAACVALAVPLERYYRIPNFAGVLLVLSSMPVLQALRSPGLPSLRRRLDYRSLYWVDLAQIVVGTLASLVAAWYLRSVWAIALGTVSGYAAAAVASYVVCPVRPRRTVDWSVAREISGLSRQILVNTFLMAAWLNTDRLVGARYLSPEQMGLYAVALSLAMAFDSVLARLGDVYFSMLAGMPDQAAKRLRHGTTIERVVRWSVPPLAISIAACPAVIRLLYDPRYRAAGPILGLLFCRALIRGLAQLNYGYMLASGSIRISNLSYLAAAAVQVVLIVPCLRTSGIAGLGWLNVLSAACYMATQVVLLRVRGDGRLRPFAAAFAWLALGVALMVGLGASP